MYNCLKCRVNMAWRISGYKHRNNMLMRENEKLREQVRRYQEIMKTDDELRWLDMDDDEKLNDIFPDEEEL